MTYSPATKLSPHTLRCDWAPPKGVEYVGPGFCAAIFQTYAIKGVVRESAEVAGWFVREGKSPRHLCPQHKATPTTGLMPDRRTETKIETTK